MTVNNKKTIEATGGPSELWYAKKASRCVNQKSAGKNHKQNGTCNTILVEERE